MKMQLQRLQLATIFLLMMLAGQAFADERHKHDNVDKDHLAVQGYDVVAYFSGKAVKGDKGVSIRHNGHVYRFSTAANRDSFIKAPNQYEPAYGGWCATAMAEGKKVEIDPANFKVTHGRLFLFYSSFFTNARNDWVQDEPTYTRKADEHWKKVVGQ